MNTLGLFPLELVLFPGSSLPLHIFEARYKSLINTVLKEKSVFGINLIDSSKVLPVGCTAGIDKVLRRLPDGQMDIIVSGVRRYRLNSLIEGEEAYFVGQVEYFDDKEEEPDKKLRSRCLDVFNTMASMVYTGDARIAKDAIDTMEHLSFRIAEKAGLELDKKQELLEMVSENERLHFLYDFISSYLPDLTKQWKVSEIIRNDGFLPRRGTRDESDAL